MSEDCNECNLIGQASCPEHGREMSNPTLGAKEGDVCWRGGCQGQLVLQPPVNCSCHINPPCSACTSVKLWCPECEWVEPDEVMNGYEIMHDKTKPLEGGQFVMASWKPVPLDPRKIDYRIFAHTNSSQKCEGVYPEGTTQAQIEALTKGTFGGRFTQFGGGRFTYIAYTD